jgi:hypothetical protein
MQNALLSILSTTGAVVIVANDKLEGSPVLTPSLDNMGNPKTDLNGHELASLRLEQVTRSLNGSFVNSRKRVAFLTGTMEELSSILKQNKLGAGSQIPGKILQIESLEPMWKGQSSKVNPQTGEAIGVTVGDKFYPVYMQQRFTEDMNATDTLIRSAEDVNVWISNRRALAAINTPVETAELPQA